MITRRHLLSAPLGLCLLGAGGGALAADPPRIGYLTTENETGHTSLDAFRQGLTDLGYVEGRNLLIEYRFANYDDAVLPAMARSLVDAHVAMIVALQPSAARAAQQATTTIPIVMRSTADPIETGLATSLGRPGGNITGVTSSTVALYGKRLELLKELLPGLRRVASIWNSTELMSPDIRAQIDGDAKKLDLELTQLRVADEAELRSALAKIAEAGVQGLLPLRDPFMVSHSNLVAQLCIAHRLPAVSDTEFFPAAGGLISYGASLPAVHQRAAYFVDKILKGTRPADLPIEEPTTFELVVNLKTAKALGLTVPPSILARADGVIE